MKRQTLTDKIMNEVIIFGGIPLRRCDAFTIAQENQPDWNPGDKFGCDYQAFAPKAVDMEPYTLEEYRALEAGDMRVPARLVAALRA